MTNHTKEVLDGPRRRFAEEYVHDGNGTRAYRVAYPDSGYAAARTGASRLLKRPAVAAEVRAGRLEQRRRTRVTAERLIKMLAAVATADIADVFDADGRPLPPPAIPAATRLAVKSLAVDRVTGAAGDVTKTYRVVFFDKLKALDLLARHLGLDRPPPPLEVILTVVPGALCHEVEAALAARG